MKIKMYLYNNEFKNGCINYYIAAIDDGTFVLFTEGKKDGVIKAVCKGDNIKDIITVIKSMVELEMTFKDVIHKMEDVANDLNGLLSKAIDIRDFAYPDENVDCDYLDFPNDNINVV